MLKIPKRPQSTIPLVAKVIKSKLATVLLSPLEKATEGKSVPSDGTRVVTAEKLTPELLDDFFSNRILAIRIPGFCPPEVCEVTAANILKEPLVNWNVYDLKKEFKASDVNVLGDPFNMANKTDDAWKNYFTNAIANSEKIRHMSAPYAFPMDRFRIMMDENWKYGLTVQRYKGLKMAPGLTRIMYEKEIKQTPIPMGCHIDSPPVLSDKAGLFSVNVYLKQPESGGHLYIWNPQITTLRKVLANWGLIKNFFLESNYMNEEIQTRYQKLLPQPQLVEVKQGDALLLNTGRPHAVMPFRGGPRVSLQAFLTFKKNKPVGIWA